MPTLQDEVAFISSVNANGTLAKNAYYGWDQNTPATYNSGWTTGRKWGANTAGTSGGTVTYCFDPAANWTATEQSWFVAGLALWSAVANIKFVQTTNSAAAGITFHRTNDNGSYTYAIFNPGYNGCVTGGTVLGSMVVASVNIDTTGTSFGPINSLASQGGFTIENLLHEEGHALGLGHAGPYNGGVNATTQQYSPYDTRQWSLMSYIDPTTYPTAYYKQYTSYANYNGAQPTTPQMLDIQAIQRLYGVPTTTPLDGGEVFGFNCNITGAIRPFFDFTQNTKPVITIWDKGTGNTLDLSGFTGTASVNLNPGTFSSTNGMKNNIGIASGTRIDRLVCTSGGTSVTCNDDSDSVIGGNGNDTIRGGAGNDTLNGGNGNDVLSGGLGTNYLNGGMGTDTASYSGLAAAYKVVTNTNGTLTVTGTGLKDTLTSIEILKFSDQTITLSTGQSGTGGGNTSADVGQIGWDSSAMLQQSTDASSGTAATDVLASAGTLGNLAPQAANTSLTMPGALLLASGSSAWHIATM